MTRRTPEETDIAIKKVEALVAGGMLVHHALKQEKVSDTSWYIRKRKAKRAARVGRGSPPHSKREENIERLDAVAKLISEGVDRKTAIRRAGFRSEAKFYYYKMILKRNGGAATNGHGTALVPVAENITVDKQGRKMIRADFIWPALERLHMSAEQLEATIGCVPGSVRKFLLDGMCPNEFALAVNGLLVSVHTSKTGMGGYVDKRTQEVFMVRLSGGHTGALSHLVEHLGGRVTREEN